MRKTMKLIICDYQIINSNDDDDDDDDDGEDDNGSKRKVKGTHGLSTEPVGEFGIKSSV